VGCDPEQKPVAASQTGLLRKAIPMARAIGTSMLIMEDITVEKLELCHQANRLLIFFLSPSDPWDL